MSEKPCSSLPGRNAVGDLIKTAAEIACICDGFMIKFQHQLQGAIPDLERTDFNIELASELHAWTLRYGSDGRGTCPALPRFCTDCRQYRYPVAALHRLYPGSLLLLAHVVPQHYGEAAREHGFFASLASGSGKAADLHWQMPHDHQPAA